MSIAAPKFATSCIRIVIQPESSGWEERCPSSNQYCHYGEKINKIKIIIKKLSELSMFTYDFLFNIAIDKANQASMFMFYTHILPLLILFSLLGTCLGVLLSMDTLFIKPTEW